MSSTHPETPAHYFRLDDEAWEAIGAEYRDGATAAALAAKWKVARSTVYAQMQKRGWSKRHDASATVRASVRIAEAMAAPVVSPEAEPEIIRGDGVGDVTEMDPRDAIDRWMKREMFDPAIIARIAASCSAGAFLQREADASLVFAQIAMQHAKLARMMPETEREIVLDALMNRAQADHLFSFTRRDGEEELKRAYWDWRKEEDTRLEMLRDRVRTLEARLRESGVSAE